MYPVFLIFLIRLKAQHCVSILIPHAIDFEDISYENLINMGNKTLKKISLVTHLI